MSTVTTVRDSRYVWFVTAVVAVNVAALAIVRNTALGSVFFRTL